MDGLDLDSGQSFWKWMIGGIYYINISKNKLSQIIC